MSKAKEIYKCHKCGEILTEDNCRPCNKSYTNMSFMCVSCESAMFDDLAKIEGRYIALFHICAILDIPIKPIVLEDVDFDKIEQPFITYINLLQEKKLNTKKGKLLGFKDGITDLRGLFGKSLSHSDFVACIENEKKKIAEEEKKKQNQGGTDEQREMWGTGILYKPQDARIPMLMMTTEVYDDLDRVYDNRTSSFKGQDLTPQQQSVIIRICKKEIIADHLTRYGATKQAAEIEKSISSLLGDENMRPKDKKPVEELRLDALVLALEEAGLMENGDLLTYDELIKVLQDEFVKSKKYNYSLDVADQVILDIINSMRYNADLPYIQDLPKEFAPVDEYGEFEPEETEREKENKRFLGITKVNIIKSDKGEN